MDMKKLLPEGWQNRLHNTMKVLAVILVIAGICWIAGKLQNGLPPHTK